MHDVIKSSEQYTNANIAAIRAELASLLSEKNYAVVTGGSYARGEASPQSDLDWFVICDSCGAQVQAEEDLPIIRNVLKKYVSKDPSAGGAFGNTVESIETMWNNIGGEHDHNHKITRRVLYLLEGAWLLDSDRFTQYRERIIGRYIQPSISDHQFCRFLLNDLIRYYRTVCVDFEHKTKEEGKEWGTRNIKLIFSRKLLYFSGVLVAAETWQHTYETKVQKIKDLLFLTPIRRISLVCGDRAESALNAYGEFLRKMADPNVRQMLDQVTDIKDQQPPEFRSFKNAGHHFSWMLAKLLKDTYDSSHPIHNALIV